MHKAFKSVRPSLQQFSRTTALLQHAAPASLLAHIRPYETFKKLVFQVQRLQGFPLHSALLQPEHCCCSDLCSTWFCTLRASVPAERGGVWGPVREPAGGRWQSSLWKNQTSTGCTNYIWRTFILQLAKDQGKGKELYLLIIYFSLSPASWDLKMNFSWV